MSLDDRLDILGREILRWNAQISLVSRVEPATTVNKLVPQCQRAWTLVVGHLAASNWEHDLALVDIGSGSGLPGLVWAAQCREEDRSGGVTLVEPRQKRAWFLNRVARAMGLAEVSVVPERWGERARVRRRPGIEQVVLAFKALRMSDGEALSGLEAAFDRWRPHRLAIVRFLVPGDREVTSLETIFGSGRQEGWEHEASAVLAAGDAGVLVTRYRPA